MIRFAPIYGSTFEVVVPDVSTNYDISEIAKDATHLLITLTSSGYPVSIKLGPSPQTATSADYYLDEGLPMIISRNQDDNNIAVIATLEGSNNTIYITAGYAY